MRRAPLPSNLKFRSGRPRDHIARERHA